MDSVQEGVRPKHAEQVPDLVRACARSCIDPSDHQLESQVASVRFNVRQSRRDGARQRNNMLRESRYNATDGFDNCEEHVVKRTRRLPSCRAWRARRARRRKNMFAGSLRRSALCIAV